MTDIGKFPNGLQRIFDEAPEAINQTALAREIDATKQDVTRWLKGQRKIPPEKALKGIDEIARAILAVNEQDSRDRRLLTEHTRRVSKALRVLSQRQVVKRGTTPQGAVTWRKARDSSG